MTTLIRGELIKTITTRTIFAYAAMGVVLAVGEGPPAPARGRLRRGGRRGRRAGHGDHPGGRAAAAGRPARPGGERGQRRADCRREPRRGGAVGDLRRRARRTGSQPGRRRHRDAGRDLRRAAARAGAQRHDPRRHAVRRRAGRRRSRTDDAVDGRGGRGARRLDAGGAGRGGRRGEAARHRMTAAREPSQDARRPLGRRAWAFDAAVALAAAAVELGWVLGYDRSPPPVAVGLAFLAGAVLVWRRRQPLVILGVSLAAVLGDTPR